MTFIRLRIDHWRKPWVNAQGGHAEARRAKAGASADSAEEMKDTTGVNPWKLHFASLSSTLPTRLMASASILASLSQNFWNSGASR